MINMDILTFQDLIIKMLSEINEKVYFKKICLIEHTDFLVMLIKLLRFLHYY